MLSDLQFRKSLNCSKFQILINKKNKNIQNYQFHEISGNKLNENYLIQNGFNYPIIIKDNKENIELKVPSNIQTLSDISKIIGKDFQVKIIDVGSQHEIEGWTIGDYAQYLEQRGKMHKILNMITLEVSGTPLTSHLLSPLAVRMMDWIDLYWPYTRRARGGDYPRVQKYVLAGMGGSYTDFHVDFGGTSVWYHVVTGEKIFYVIPPTPENLRAYRNWITSSNQDSVFFADTLSNKNYCQRISVKAGQTLFLPGGWIHAVYTPVDSLVYGGNFLLSPCILLQLQVHSVEVSSHIARKYLFPYYKQMSWYTVCCTLQRFQYDIKKQNSFISSLPPPPYPPILSFPIVVYQWIYLIKYCEIWITSSSQLLEDKEMFKEISKECYENIDDEKLQIEYDNQDLSLKVISDWWLILETYEFSVPSLDYLPKGINSNDEYIQSIRRLTQEIKNLSTIEFDLLNENIYTLFPLHDTYKSILSNEIINEETNNNDNNDNDNNNEKDVNSICKSESKDIKNEMKIKIKLHKGNINNEERDEINIQPNDDEEIENFESYSSDYDDEKDDEYEEVEKPKPQNIKLKFTLPPQKSTANKASSKKNAPVKEIVNEAPLSRTRGKRLSLSFLQSATDFDIDIDQNSNIEQSENSMNNNESDELNQFQELQNDDEDDEYMNDPEEQEHFKSDQLAEIFGYDDDEDNKSKKGKKRKIVHHNEMYEAKEKKKEVKSTLVNKKSKQKLGPGALLRKKLAR